MPFIFSERLPVPTLRSYCSVSLVIFAASIIYWKNAHWTEENGFDLSIAVLEEPFILWPLVNMAFCVLFLFGKVVQRLLLGNLHITEEQHLQEKFWNFVFYKMIFIFGVVNAQSLHEVLCWMTWFSLLGFLVIFLQLCKDRFDHATSTPTMPQADHFKLLVLIFSISICSVTLASAASMHIESWGLNYLVFMLTESILIGLKSLHLAIKYIFQLKNLMNTGLWDTKAQIVYYTDLFLKFLILSIDLGFHFHMLLWSNVFVSMASLVLYWNIRTIFSEIKKLLKKHRLNRKILKSVNTRFPMAMEEELESLEDHCAICWDKLDTARKLPCSHYFHHACLCSWLERDLSCPTCRRSLSADIGLPPGVGGEQAEGNTIEQDELEEIAAENRNENNQGGLRNYFFYLDGQQIANWFPSFSIEVFHGRMGQTSDEELHEMTQRLVTMFPHVSREAIVQDLRQTNSVEATADNILEGHFPSSEDEEDEAPTLITPEERPEVNLQQVTSAIALDSSQVLSAHPSDSEAFIEDSSGTEDSSTTARRVEGSSLRNRMRSSQRRQQKRSSHNNSASDPPDTPASVDLNPANANVSNNTERRALFLEAFESRNLRDGTRN